MLLIILTTLLVNCMSKKPPIKTSHNASGSSTSVLLTHPRITNICLVHTEGKEGAGIKGFQLQKVFITTNSGLKTPCIHNRQSSSFDPDEHSHFCMFSDSTKNNKPKQVENYLKTLLVKEKLRGKATKSGFKIFYSQPGTEHCKSQRLSSFGILQLINLGKYLLRSYFGKMKSLDSDLMYTGFAVTFGDESLFHSLHALLFGLLTEKQFVHTHIDKSAADFSPGTHTIDGYKDVHYFIEQAFTKESHLFKDSKVSTIGRSSLIDQFFGPDVSVKDIIGHLSNSLCSTSSDKSAETVEITYQDVTNIFNTSDFYNRYLTTSTTFRSYSVARTFSLRRLVMDFLSPSMLLDKQTTATNRDLRIITVDDLFMLSFLTSLNVPVSQHLLPSSRLIIESFSGPVLHTVHSQSVGHQHSHAKNQGSKVNEENTSEKEDLNGSSYFVNQRGNTSSGITQNSFAFPSPPLRSSDEDSGKTNNDLKLATSKSPPVYIRVLYNGQIVTSNVPGCESDPLVSLGLCSIETVDIILDLTEWKQYPVRDEL